MALNYLATDLWRRHRPLSAVLLGGLVVNLCLSFLLLGVMMPRLERDRAVLIQRQTAGTETARSSAGNGPVQASARLDAFYRQIPPYAHFPDFLKQLYQYARDAGLNIDRITYKPSQTDLGNVLSYAMDFSVKGRYSQIKEFLQALESWPQLVVVEQVQLAGQSPDRDEVVLSMRLTAYFSSGAS